MFDKAQREMYIGMLILLIIGVITGILSGLFGVGGCVVLIPLLMATGLSISQAVAIGLLLQSLPQSLPGVYLYWKNGHMDWNKAILVAIGSFIGIWIGAYFATKDILSERVKTRFMSVLIGVVSIYLWFIS